jgi:hypothetical protein
MGLSREKRKYFSNFLTQRRGDAEKKRKKIKSVFLCVFAPLREVFPLFFLCASA